MAASSPTLAHDAVRERCSLAASYAAAAAALAATGDTPAMAHSLGCAARTILAAVEAAETLRPSNKRGCA
jgi:alcohol dehydrogenase class IV